MVARIATGKNIRGMLHYNEQKVQEGRAELLHAGLFPQEASALTLREKLRRFTRLQERAPRVKTNALHLSLNFHPGEKLSPNQLTRIAVRYMEQIGFGAQPYLVYCHMDAGHPHLHIVTTNITKDGKRLNLHNIGREKSEPARKAIEQEFGLLPAEKNPLRQELPTPLEQLEKVRYGVGETRRAISQVVTGVLASYNVTSLAQLNAVLGQYGILADRGPEHSQMHQRKGLLYSVVDREGRKQGVPQKASSLPGKPTLPRLEKQFAWNEVARAPYRAAVRQQVDMALQRVARDGSQAFLHYLNQAGIQVLFRQSEAGAIYGITYVDHRNLAVVNGRELGKGYGARHLLNRLAGLSPGRAGSLALSPSKGSSEIQVYNVSDNLPGHLVSEAGILGQLLEADQQVAYLPFGLKPRKRKHRKQQHPL